MPSQSLSFETFENALNNLEVILTRDLDEDDVVRDAAIQRFEYSVELSWKTLKRYLKIVHTKDEAATREIYRLAERFEIIEDHVPWFHYLEARNLTSHTYDKNTAQNVYDTAHAFLKSAKALLEAMKDGYDRHCS